MNVLDLWDDVDEEEQAAPEKAPAFSPPPMPDRSAPQGTMPTAQEQDVAPGPVKWQQTATDIAESAPGRFVRAAAEAVPKTLENVGTVAGMMVGAPLIAQGAKALPGIASGAAGAVAQAAKNPIDLLRQRPLAAPIGGALAEGAVMQEKLNPATGGLASEALASAGPVAGGAKKAASLLDRYGNAIDNSAEALAAEEAHAQSVLERLRARSEALREQAPPRSPEELFREGLRDEREAQSRYESFRGRLDEAQAAAQAAEPPAPPTIDAAFNAASDAEAARRRASTLDLGGERGAAGFGLVVDPVRRLAKQAVEKVDNVINTNPLVGELKKAVHFVEDKIAEYGVGAVSPQLRKFPSSVPTVSLDKVRSMTHSRQNSALLSAQERGVAETSNISKDEYGPITDYLRASNFKARLDSGIDKLPGGMTPAQVDMALMDSADQLTPARLSELEGKYRAWTKELGDRAEKVGVLEPGQRRVDYMPHLVRKFFEEEPQAAAGAAGSLFSKPGFTKKAVGSLADIESDPYKAAVFVDYMTGRAEHMREFFDEVTRYSANAELRAGTRAFDPEKDALFSFSPSGRSQTLTGPRAENEVKAFLSREVGPGGVATAVDPAAPFPPDPSVAKQIKGWFVVPKELAEGAANFDANGGALATKMFGKAGAKILDVSAEIARTTQLLLSPSFQLGQIPADVATALANIPASKHASFLKDFADNVASLSSEYARIRGGGKSDLLVQLRRDGYLNDIAETVIDTDLGGVVSEHAIAKVHRAPPEGPLGRLKEKWRDFKEPIIEAGQIREGSVKLALGKAFSEMGLDPKAAVYLANDRTGGYYHRSAWGKVASKLILNSKWYTTQIKRLTRDIAKNVRTGRSDLTGLLEGPAPKLAAMAALTYAANHRDERTAEAYDKLPLGKKASIILWVDDNGDAVTVTPDTLLTLGSAIYETARSASSDLGGTVSQLVDASKNRMNPVPKMALNWAMPGKLPMEEQDASEEDLLKANVKQGGLPGLTPQQQRTFVTPWTGAPGRFLGDVLSTDTSGWDKARRVAGDVGLPVPGFRLDKVRGDAGIAQLMAMKSDDIKSGIVNAAASGDEKKLAALTDVYFSLNLGSPGDYKRLFVTSAKKGYELESMTAEERKDARRARLGDVDAAQMDALRYNIGDLWDD